MRIFIETAQARKAAEKLQVTNSWIRCPRIICSYYCSWHWHFCTQNNQLQQYCKKGSVDEFEYTEKSTMMKQLHFVYI